MQEIRQEEVLAEVVRSLLSNILIMFTEAPVYIEPLQEFIESMLLVCYLVFILHLHRKKKALSLQYGVYNLYSIINIICFG